MSDLFSESGRCGVDVAVIFPGESKKKKTTIHVSNIHGDDFTVKQVKRHLLGLKGLENQHESYSLIGGDGTKTVVLNDETLITDDAYTAYLMSHDGYLALEPRV
ncbi:unnamed protein product [Lymnaea stagnalis]|uniref:Ubiquitin-like domain-containing protein n=1 Tax=Lymnaea stagnalis TaxID=6523 RepID=A0AAV2HKJ9_LYMST